MTPMPCVRDVWNSHDSQVWREALGRYWSSGIIRPENMPLEKEFESLDPGEVQEMSPDAWYQFLLDKYFRWKYTAPNRYASTTKSLKEYRGLPSGMADLHGIKSEIFQFDQTNIGTGLVIACKIRGLGIAGASGLLAVLFPQRFGTVDQFALKALRGAGQLSEPPAGRKAKEETIGFTKAVAMIEIMRTKAIDNNRIFATDFWTPRRIDMVLWASEPRRKRQL